MIISQVGIENPTVLIHRVRCFEFYRRIRRQKSEETCRRWGGRREIPGPTLQNAGALATVDDGGGGGGGCVTVDGYFGEDDCGGLAICVGKSKANSTIRVALIGHNYF